jgi:spore germination protein
MKKKQWKPVLGALAAAVLASGLALSVSAYRSATPVSSTRDQGMQQHVWGYQPWWMSANWPSVDLGLWHRAIFFELAVEADGRISNIDTLPAGWQGMGAAAAGCGSALDLAFTMFDEKKFEQLFTSTAHRMALLDEILALTRAAGAQGAHLDFEIYKRVSDASVAGFRDFVRQLRERLRQENGASVLSLFGVVGAAQNLLDRDTMPHVDFIVIQGYDMNWIAGPNAGPVAPLRGSHPLNWEKSLQHYLKLGAERSRLLFSIPYFGYEWPTQSGAPGSATTGRGVEMTYAPVSAEWVPRIPFSALARSKAHGSLRDPETGSPYYAYRDSSGNWRQGWYEDETSLSEKLAFIKREQLAGVAAFPLGYDAGQMDAVVGGAFGRRPHCRPGGGSAATAH